VRCVHIGSVSDTALQGVDKFSPYFRCCVYRPIWVKSGVKDLHTLPFGTWSSVEIGTVKAVLLFVVNEITLTRVP